MTVEIPQNMTGAEAFSAALLDALNEAVIGVGAGGVVRVWNRAAATLLGLGTDAALGRPLTGLLRCPAAPHALGEALRAGKDFRLAGAFAVEGVATEVGGATIVSGAISDRGAIQKPYLELVGTVASADGSYVILVRDLSQRIAAEEENQRLIGQVQVEQARNEALAERAAAAAQEAGRRITEILESISDAYYSVDPDWKITNANAAAARYFARASGGAGADLHGADLRRLLSDGPRRVSFERLAEAAARRAPARFEEADHAAGRWYEVSAYPTNEGLAVFYRDITTRKRAEEARRRAYSLLEGIAENTLDMVAAVDTEYNFTFFNQSYADTFRAGYGVAPAVGMNMMEVVSAVPGERENAAAMFEVALQGQKVRGTGDFGDPARRRRTYEVRLSPINDDEGSIIGVGMIASDVTERERTQRALLASNSHYQTLALATFEGILFSEGDYILDLNEQMAEMLGYSVDEMLGQPMLKYIDPLDHPVIYDYVEYRRTGVVELRLIRKDGSRIISESRGRLVPYEGRTVRVSTVRDVTNQRAALAALRESEERYHTLFNNRHSPMLLIDPDSGRIVDANPAASMYYGWEHTELVGKPMSEINLLPAEQVRQKMQLARTGTLTEPLAFHHRLASGEIRDVEAHTGPIRLGGKDFLFSIIVDVTERARAEQALAESEQRFRKALETIPDVVVLYGPDLRVRYINSACERITGRPPAHFLGKRDDEVWPAEVYDLYLPQINQAFSTGDPQVVDADLAVGEDGYRSLSITYIPLIGENGVVNELMGVIHDNTARVQAEEAVRESERLFRTIASSFPNGGVLVVDEHMRVRAAEGRLMAELGASGAEAQGRLLRDIFKGSVLRRLDMHLRRALTGETASVEMEIQDRVVLAQFVPLEDESGQITTAMGMALDITDQKAVERALRESESRFRTSVESLMDGFAILSAIRDDEGRIIDFRYDYMNEAGCQMNDRTSEEQVGQRLLELLPGHRESGLFNRYVQLVETGVPVVVEDDDYEDIYGGGRRVRRTFEVRAMKLADGFVVTWRDITRRKETQIQLHSYAEQLERSNRELEQFAFVASHDLQEPLRKIRMFGDTLRSKLGDVLVDEARDSLDRMTAATERMQTMINGLLDLSRVNTRGETFSSVDLNHEAAEVLSDLELRIQSTGGVVKVGPLPTLDADAMQMRQLFQNLIGNALKFHRAGVPPEVSVTSAVTMGSRRVARIVVEDNGIGFEQEFAERIFQPFQRLHGRSEYEGTGMGLAICQRIVERHHGSIEVRSTPGQGSVFTIALPLRQEKEE